MEKVKQRLAEIANYVDKVNPSEMPTLHIVLRLVGHSYLLFSSFLTHMLLFIIYQVYIYTVQAP